MKTLAPNTPEIKLSRETAKILIEMKRVLSQEGKTMSLVGPDVVLQALHMSSAIDHQEIQDCRRRLIASLPHDEEVYFFDASPGQLTCMACGYVLTVQIDERVLVSCPHVIQCQCGQFYQVAYGLRRHPRKAVNLKGRYRAHETDKAFEPMVVENLSLGGLRLHVVNPNPMTREPILHVEFTLDDAFGTVIQEPVEVRYLSGDRLGGRFLNSELSPALVAYLSDQESI